jgi:hypothetical protein
MKTKIIITLLISLFYGINTTRAQQIKDTIVVDYQSINTSINEKANKYGTENVLVVLDIDNTILTSDTDLGSDIWYQWQNGELEPKPTPKQKLTTNCLFNEAITLLYDLGTMKLTDSLVPNYIKNWQLKGITILALTSRNPSCRTATERELSSNNIDLSLSQLKTIEGNTFNLNYSWNNRELNYSNGIFMTSGLNKGEMLSHIINRTGKSYKAIVFVDDSRKNIDAVKNKYSTCNNVDLGLFNYTKVITERLKRNNNVVLTKEQTDKMTTDWNYLIKTLYTIFPERVRKSKCIDKNNYTN